MWRLSGESWDGAIAGLRVPRMFLHAAKLVLALSPVCEIPHGQRGIRAHLFEPIHEPIVHTRGTGIGSRIVGLILLG